MLNLLNQAYSGLDNLISGVMETLGERVRRLRLEADEMTQDALAAQVPGMSASAISQLENGNSKGVKPENLLHLSRALGVSMHELVTGKPDPAEGRTAKVASTRIVRHADPQEEKLLAAFRKLAPDRRAVVIALTALLAGCATTTFERPRRHRRGFPRR
jgi:transcriptional regulator with XRE-family HTH domain